MRPRNSDLGHQRSETTGQYQVNSSVYVHQNKYGNELPHEQYVLPSAPGNEDIFIDISKLPCQPREKYVKAHAF